jgi:hypothetical protein
MLAAALFVGLYFNTPTSLAIGLVMIAAVFIVSIFFWKVE